MRRLAPRRPAARFSTAHGQHQHPHEAPKAPAAPLTPQEFCRQIVQQRDRDHYACTLFLPKKSQDAVFAVRALNVELASLRDVAKQGPARIGRVQFWRHLVDETYKGNPPEQPIAKALAAAVKDHQLTKGWVLRILDSREKDLNDRIPLKIEDAESYAEGTQSALLYLTLESCGVKNVNADHAASHIGKAYGLVNLLRALPFTAAQRQTYLPLSLLNKHKVMMEDVFRGKNSPELQNVVWDVASNANVHLEHARSLRKTVPVAARSALLSGVIAGQWLSRLQKCDFDVFHPSLRTPDPWQFARLYWAHIRANY